MASQMTDTYAEETTGGIKKFVAKIINKHRHECPTRKCNVCPPPEGITKSWVAKTGQTTQYEAGDDGDLERGVAWPNPRFTDNLDGTITDNLTCLIWDKDANRFGAKLDWSDAVSYCNNLADNGGDLTDGSVTGDWHLANRFELESLLHLGFFSPAVPDTLGTGQWSQGDPFNNMQSLGLGYWSSSTNVVSNFGWSVSFLDGHVGSAPVRIDGLHIWCVRGGP